MDHSRNNVVVLFEDDDVLAVHKPEELASISERDREKENLLAQLSNVYPSKLYVVHRLDKDVSGVILFAKHAAAHKALNEQFSHRTVKKTYLAVIHGSIQEEHGIIDMPIRQFGSGRMGVDVKRGKHSLTEYSVAKRFTHYTLLHVQPVTGRRHQIRVHLYNIGYPIVGDMRYGDKQCQQRYPRLMLHASSIEFTLLDGRKMAVNVSPPQSFDAALRMLEKKL
jgi:RluA family pseudouridine synthase